MKAIILFGDVMTINDITSILQAVSAILVPIAIFILGIIYNNRIKEQEERNEKQEERKRKEEEELNSIKEYIEKNIDPLTKEYRTDPQKVDNDTFVKETVRIFNHLCNFISTEKYREKAHHLNCLIDQIWVIYVTTNNKYAGYEILNTMENLFNMIKNDFFYQEKVKYLEKFVDIINPKAN